MLISCPNCKTSFAVNAAAIGENGKKVKCSKCAHVWLQTPPQFDKEKLENLLKVENIPDIRLPAKIGKMNYGLIFTFVLFLAFSVGAEIIRTPDRFPPQILERAKLMDYEGLRFHGFSAKSEIVDNKLDFTLKGEIVNTTDKKIKLPRINIKIFSKGGRVMTENSINPPDEYIEPYARMDIEPELTGISGNADKIEISMGNWVEKFFR